MLLFTRYNTNALLVFELRISVVASNGMVVLLMADPSDELMPLSCRGRDWEHRTRGTIDDALG